ncbi:hypothetical protein C4579_03910 [Candidatus Microgenomates bacterium]|nr:MAG: hypothetical protein C4579_03910 [Candidatus Microgenomates bacterium]
MIAPPPKKSSKALLLILFILLLLAFLGSGAYYLGLMQSKTPTSVPSPMPLVQASPQASTVLDETADWETYTDPSNKFSFKYPNNLVNLQLSNGVTSFFDDPTDRDNCQNNPKSLQNNPCANNQFSFNSFRSYASEEYQKIQSDLGRPLNPKTVTDRQGRVWQTDYVYGQVFNYSATTKNNNENIVVGFQSGLYRQDGGETDEQFGERFRQFFDQILSTFEFVENGSQATCSAGFESYSNKFFDICFPIGMTVSNNYQTTDYRPGVEVARTVFEDDDEKIVINTTFAGGWGGGSCASEQTTINGVQAAIVVWDTVGQTVCNSNLVNLVSIIGEENNGDKFPVAIDYQRKGNNFLDRNKFDTVLHSLHFK